MIEERKSCSASIQAEKFSSYFHNCPILRIPGNIYPIKEYFLEDYITKLKYPFDNQSKTRRSNRQLDQKKYATYLDELQFDLAEQRKSIDVWKKIEAIGTDFSTEINCDLVVSVIEFICRISPQGILHFPLNFDLKSEISQERSLFFSPVGVILSNVVNYFVNEHYSPPIFIYYHCIVYYLYIINKKFSILLRIPRSEK